MLNLLGKSLISQLSTVVAMKALPDEVALHSYLRNVFKGIALLIAGSVLLGASIAACLYVAYDQLLSYGYNETTVIAITLGIAFALVGIFFYLADKWLSRRFRSNLHSKSIIDDKLDYIRDIAGEALNGFVEGLCERPKPRKKARYD